jgi:hypothetical protein
VVSPKILEHGRGFECLLYTIFLRVLGVHKVVAETWDPQGTAPWRACAVGEPVGTRRVGPECQYGGEVVVAPDAHIRFLIQ